MKTSTHYRLSVEALAIVKKRSEAMGISGAAWLEIHIRKADHHSEVAFGTGDAFQVSGRENFDPAILDEPTNSMSSGARAKREVKKAACADRKETLKQTVSAAMPRRAKPNASGGDFGQYDVGVDVAKAGADRAVETPRAPKSRQLTNAGPDGIGIAVRPCPIHSPKFCEQTCKYRNR